MQSISRKVGKFTNKSTAGEADVGTILEEFRVADELLDHFMDAVRSFQNAWKGILAFQFGIAQHFETLYKPIEDPESKYASESDQIALEKAQQLRATYGDLDKDLQQETDWIQTKLLQPAMDAKQSIAPLKKVVKKRENYKLDYERYQGRVDHVKQKGLKSAREEGTLAKHESDVSAALALYQSADDQIRQKMPAVIDAVQVLVPLLLNEQIMLQHALVGQLYTVLHGYCQQYRLPSPAPPMEQVVSTWNSQFAPLRHEVEQGLNVLANGKAVRQPMSGPPEKANTVTGLSIRSRLSSSKSPSQQSVPQMRRQSSNALEIEEEEQPPPKPARPGAAPTTPGARPRIASSISVQSLQSYHSVPEDEEAPPPKPPRPSPGPIPLGSKPRTASSLSVARSGLASPIPMGTPLPGLSPGLTPGNLELANARRRSSASTTLSTTESGNGRVGASPYQGDYFGQQRSASTTSIASSIASKKKPPPPPTKRQITSQDLVVTALYDFAGQGDGDLTFREGDRIKVLKKTESIDDWWLGQLRGVSGSFPANYVSIPS
ncbi:hypothetical protein K461DRAFT_177401 [Myriangium duriaei CBS 260.36]|uniref:SH3 domain-containing protein n=1 Tax=Myriangium duriaei CBS 260.36 TaxID=1168546 RepID=A0A9P4J174_9PEZI|nr:hypothetical protein K461DRAFT_177401 [Myriangium duriaei CBS 260.36]